MTTVEILGSGCAKCKRLFADTERAVQQAGIPVDLKKVEDMDAILDHGVMVTPALVIDGQVKSSGRLPPVDEISAWLREAAAKA